MKPIRALLPFCVQLVAASVPGPAWAAKGPVAPPLSVPGEPVLEGKVIEVAAEQGIIAIDKGSTAGVRVGDSVWVLNDTGSIGTGQIYFVTENKCAARWSGSAATQGQSAVVLRHEAMPMLRDRLPPGATVAGTLLRVAPGRQSAWMDINADAGLRADDQVLVSRKGIPICRGRITVLDGETALTTLEPLVSNASPEPGDRVELWPAPSDARWGRLNSTVLATQPAADALDGTQIIFPGTIADGVALERLVEVYHGREYIGLAKVTDTASPQPPFSKASMIDVATLPRVREGSGGAAAGGDSRMPRMEPAEGDRAIVRASPDREPGPLTAVVFRIEKDYCLIGAGELDGLRAGEKFLVRRQDPQEPSIWHEVALLTIEHVEPVDAGASIKRMNTDVPGVQLWDMAERQLPGGEQWRAAGIVESTDKATRTAAASVESNCRIKVGDVVRWVPEQDGAVGGAIVLRREKDRVILHVPVGWGGMEAVARARVDLRTTSGKD